MRFYFKETNEAQGTADHVTLLWLFLDFFAILNDLIILAVALFPQTTNQIAHTLILNQSEKRMGPNNVLRFEIYRS